MIKIMNEGGLHCKITSIPSRMIFVSAKEGQMQTWWENICTIFKYISYILKYISLIHQLPGFLELFNNKMARILEIVRK